MRMASDLERLITALVRLLDAPDTRHDWQPTGEQELVAAPTRDGGGILQPFNEYRCSRCGGRRLVNPDLDDDGDGGVGVTVEGP